MVATHCPSAAAGTLNPGQLACPPVPGYGTVHVPSTVDGVCVYFNGLADAMTQPPFIPADSGGILPSAAGTWVTQLVADNWAVVFFPSYPETAYPGDPAAGIVADVTSATGGNGLQYLTTLGLMWSHILDYCHANWPGKKIIVVGFSQGGFTTLVMAQYHLSTIIGGVIVNPATLWENINPIFTTPLTFSSYNWSAMDAGPTALNACTKPFLFQYGMTDIAVGYDLAGTGGTPVSNSDIMITNAVNAGMPITRSATTNNHAFTAANVTGTFMPYIEATLDPLR